MTKISNGSDTMKNKLFLLIISVMIISLVACGPNLPNVENDSAKNNDEDIVENEEGGIKEELLTIADYYPFKVDQIMDYEGIGNEFAEKTSFVEFVKNNRMQMKIMNPGTTFVKVIEYKNGALIEVFSEGEFYHIENMLNSSSNSNNIILQEPLEVGTTWTTEEGFTNKITSIDKEIETPSGAYKALEVTTELEDGGVQKDYYAKGLGLVANIYVDGDFEVKTLLKETRNDKLDIDIVSYYPNSKDTEIVTESVKQNIKFGTNDIIEDILEKIMKEPPSDELIPLISEATKINNINLDRSTWTLEIDFSEELLTEMNAGSSFEMEILKSIVNTLGEFYDVDKVYITIEGEPYESGHFGISSEEFFKVDKDGVKEFNE